MYLVKEFKDVVKNINPLTILHVGAHLAEEAKFYDELKASNVVWVEANPNLLAGLAANLKGRTNQSAIQSLLSDEVGGRVKFHISNNGQSSSMLNLKEHLKKHPEVRYIEDITLKTETIDSLWEGSAEFTVWNLDVQGAEMRVIKGGLRTLRKCQVLYTEVNFIEMYEGCCLFTEFQAELNKLGFIHHSTHDTGAGWGDAIFYRRRSQI